MSELAVEGNVNLGNFREGSDAPYAAALDRLGLSGDAPAAEATTPIQQALAQPQQPVSPYQVPGAQPPAAAASPGATEQTATPPATVVGPYDTPAAKPEAPQEDVPAWVQELRAEQAQTRAYLEQVAQSMSTLPEALTPSAQPAAEPDLDLMSADELRSYIANQASERAEALFNERIAPYTDVLGRAVQRESQEAAKAYFSELEPHVGRFDHDQAHVIALGLTAQGLPPEQAMLIGAQRQHAFEKELWTKWSQQLQGTVDNVASAPNEVPAGPVSGSEIQPTPTGRNAYEAAKDAFLAGRAPRAIPTA